MGTTNGIKPILIFEDKIQINRDLHDLDKRILPYCPAIQKAFERLGIGEISDNYLHDILNKSCSEIERELINKTKEEVQHQFTQPDAVNRAIVAVQKLRKAADILMEKCQYGGAQSLLHYLSISENGNIVFSAQSKEELKESYSQYVSTENGIKKRLLHEKAVKALQEFKNAINSNDVLEFFDFDENDDVMPVPVTYE